MNEDDDLVTRFNTNINNEDIFYGDGNNVETVRRQKKQTQIPFNFYPLSTFTYIEDKNGDSRFTIITDRAHGIVYVIYRIQFIEKWSIGIGIT